MEELKKNEQQRTTELKKSLLKSLTANLGIVSLTCEACECSRKTFYEYVKKDEAFKGAVEDIDERAIDFVESALFKQIKKGNAPSTMFYLKTKGRHRGYVERQEHVISQEQPLFPDTDVSANNND